MGASANADRAGGPADLSRSAASQPEALIPCAAPWWRCFHCGCDDYLPYREELSGHVDARLVRCANCKSTHSAPDPTSPKALRWQISELAEALENLVIDVEMGWGDPHTLADAKATLYSAQGIEAGTATTAGRGPKDESPVAESDAP